MSEGGSAFFEINFLGGYCKVKSSLMFIDCRRVLNMSWSRANQINEPVQGLHTELNWPLKPTPVHTVLQCSSVRAFHHVKLAKYLILGEESVSAKQREGKELALLLTINRLHHLHGHLQWSVTMEQIEDQIFTSKVENNIYLVIDWYPMHRYLCFSVCQSIWSS